MDVEESIRHSGARVTGECEPSDYVCWGQNSGPMEERGVFLTIISLASTLCAEMCINDTILFLLFSPHYSL